MSYKSKPVAIRELFLLSIVSVNVLLMLTMSAVFYKTHQEALISNIDKNLLSVALLAKELLPNNYLNRITGRDSISKAEFEQVVEKNNQLCVSLGLEYIWSVMETEDKRVVFTTATSPDKITDNKQHASFFEEHSNSEFYRKAFQNMRLLSCSLKDQWGEMRVTLLPVYDAAGRKHLLGVSISLASMHRQLQTIIWKTLLFGCGMLIFSLLLVFPVMRGVVRPLQRLTKTIQTHADDLKPLEVKEEGAVEIRLLARHLNCLNQLLYGRITDLESSHTSLVSLREEECRETRAHLLNSEQRYRNLLNYAVDGILIGTRQGYITDANECMCSMFGLPREKIIGKHISEMHFTPDSLLRKPLDFQAMVRGKLVVCERTIVRPDNTRIDVEMHSKCLPDGSLQTFYRDVSERTKARMVLEELNQSLERRVDERTSEVKKYSNDLRALTGRLIHAEEKERRRIAKILHEDLQQTLAVAKMLLGSVLGQVTEVKEEQGLLVRVDQILDEAFRLTRTLVLEIFIPAVKDGELHQSICWFVQQIKGKFDLTVEVVCEKPLHPVREDVCQYLCRAVQELLFNVVKHAQTKWAQVTLCEKSNGDVQMTVRDNGCGFDPKKDSEMKTEWGIGLFGIREVIEGLGGKMTVSSAQGQGTTVMLVLPNEKVGQTPEQGKTVEEKDCEKRG